MKCKNKAKEKKISQAGFTLVELMVAAAILIITIVGILISYVQCLELTEMSKNTSIATNAVRGRIEFIKDTDFNQVFANFDQVTFTTPGLTGMGVSYVDNSNPDLLQITLTFCWRQRSGRIIGEDTNLNGVLNAGEDTNVNGILDSRVQIVTYMFDK